MLKKFTWHKFVMMVEYLAATWSILYVLLGFRGFGISPEDGWEFEVLCLLLFLSIRLIIRNARIEHVVGERGSAEKNYKYAEKDKETVPEHFEYCRGYLHAMQKTENILHHIKEDRYTNTHWK